MSLYERLLEEFERRFARPPVCIVRAPGRVGLFGMRAPGSQSRVLTVGIDRSVWIALEPRDDGQVLVHNVGKQGDLQFDLRSELHQSGEEWANCILGIAQELKHHGFKLEGWQGIVTADSPPGNPCTFPAAIQMATARVFSIASGFTWDAAKFAAIAIQMQPVSPERADDGVEKITAAVARRDCALWIHDASLVYESVLIPFNYSLLLLLPATYSSILSADLGQEYFDSEKGQAEAAYKALRQADVDRIRSLFATSHRALVDSLPNVDPELNDFVNVVSGVPGCVGARVTDSSFGMAAVALVDADKQDQVVEAWMSSGARREPLRCKAVDGAEIVDHLPRPGRT